MPANPLARITPVDQRLWEVDWLRGMAIVLVVYYHLVFDLQYFGLLDIEWRSLTWIAQAKMIKSIFLFLVGVSLQLSVTAARQRQASDAPLLWRYLGRGIAIFAIAMLITLITSIVLPKGTIHFGILHAIGASILLTYPLLRLGTWLLVPGIVLIVLAFWIRNYQIDGLWLIWLGVLPHDYWTVDYAPLIPNLGIVFLGVCAALWCYPANQRRIGLKPHAGNTVHRLLCWMGRHSLIIYLLHQPFLFGLLYTLDLLKIVHIAT